jgi:hypothetical protein
VLSLFCRYKKDYSCSIDLAIVITQILKLKGAVTMDADRIGVGSWYIQQSTVILSVLPISSQIHIRYRHSYLPLL